MKHFIQLWKHFYRRSKPEASQSSALWWRFSFISANCEFCL